MGVQINFDSRSVVPSTGASDPIPAGWYIVAADESELKPTSSGDGAYIKFRFNVLDGKYTGRKLFVNLNVKNANAQAQEIAYRDLAAICHAVGLVGMVPDTEMIHGRPLKVRVKIRPATDKYEAQNDITAYRNVNDPDAVNAAPAAALGGVPPGFGAPPAQAPAPAPQWAPQGAQQGPAPAVYAPQGAAPMGYQQPAPQQPAPGGWQPPAGGAQPWQQPAPAAAPVQQPQQYAPAPQQYAPAPQPGPGAAQQPPPWAAQ